MTLLLASIIGPSFDDAMRAVRRAITAGTDGVELRLDAMPDVTDEQVMMLLAEMPDDRHAMLTIRSRDEGGQFDGPDADRVSRLIALGPLFDSIDVEAALWQRSANIRQKIMLAIERPAHEPSPLDVADGAVGARDETAETASEPASRGRRVLILSHHDTRGRPPRLSAELLDLVQEARCDVIKLAWAARSLRECFEAFELMRDRHKPIVAICMGDNGLISRLLAPKFGAWAAFAAVDDESAAAPGQLTLDELKRRYRWDAIGPRTAVFGVIGDPIGHSLSPAVFNAAFEAAGIDAVYAPLWVRPGYESFKAFMVEALARPWLDLRGLSVTSPHKEHALRFVTEQGGRVDDPARRIGAVNTLSIEADGALAASNTDAAAVIAALCAGTRVTPPQLRGTPVAILGAGGAARAAAAALREIGAEVTVYGRSRARADALAADLDCRAASWEERHSHAAQVLINCTPIGQSPDENAIPIDASSLRGDMIVFDTVYRPRRTRLLIETQACGCRVVEGLEMFLHQAAAQWRAWTGRDAPLPVMRSAATE